MSSTSFVVKFVPVGHCFVTLSQPLAERILKRSSEQKHKQTTLELSWTHHQQVKKVYVGWAGEICKPSFSSWTSRMMEEDTILSEGIELDPVFGHALGLSESQKVTVKVINPVSKAQRVFVEPFTEDDWELVEWNANVLEETILKQIQVIFPLQKIPLHTKNRKETLYVQVQEDPALHPCCLLDIETEIAVQPKQREKPPPALSLRVCASSPLSDTAMVSTSTFQVLQGSRYQSLQLTLMLPLLRSSGWSTWSPTSPLISFSSSEMVSDEEIHVPSHLASTFTWFPPTWETWIEVNFHGARVKCSPTNSPPTFSFKDEPKASTSASSLSMSVWVSNSNKSETLTSFPWVHVLNEWTHSVWKPSCVCVTGPPGAGKSYLVQAFLATLQQDHVTCPWTVYVPCDRLSKELPVGPFFHDLGALALTRRPSVVVLDRVDHWIPSTHEVDMKPSNFLAWQVVKAITSFQNVRFILVAESIPSLNPILKEHYVFHKEITLGLGTVDELDMIYSSLLPRYTCANEVDSTTLAKLTEGFVAQDCVHLFQRAHPIALREHFFHPTSKSVQEGDSRFSPIQLTMAHFHEALKDYRPLRLSQGLQKEGGVAWSQVGGMFEVKQQLLEIFQWPLKYAHLLDSNASWVKLPTGVLLYGYPGCGKTWLGRAIAHEVGMSFMMVRGPELLDKYVGGSEARVREVFRKARLATPCLVFIDEVDALTPPRGQSSTMDRLVNQVLTELDGVEGRKGVYVMGATSRPDLMDPAMLRPGRLDTSIRCGFPTYQERMDLFTLLSHQPPMKVNIHDWHEWAQQTEGYTYADVQGFITQAYTEAVQWHLRSLESSTFDHSLQQGNNLSFPKKSDASWKSEPEGHDLSMYYPVSTTSTTPTPSSFTQPIEITELHLKKALEVMKPSLTEATRQQLTRIYDLFERGKVEMPVSGKLKFK